MTASVGDDRYDRDAILGMLLEVMETVEEQIAAAEPTTVDEQRLQLRRVHELGYLTNQYRKLKRDTDLDEMQEDLALLQTEGGPVEDSRE